MKARPAQLDPWHGGSGERGLWAGAARLPAGLPHRPFVSLLRDDAMLLLIAKTTEAMALKSAKRSALQDLPMSLGAWVKGL